MQTTQIENMSAADLKAQKAEIVTAIAAAPPEDLAGRYVQARIDASLRDEKLSEQGQTITTLNEALGLAKGEIARLQDELKAAREAAAAEMLLRRQDGDAHLDEQIRDAELIKQLRASLQAEAARADRLKNAAGRMHAASAKAAQQLNEALSAQAIAAADEGQ